MFYVLNASPSPSVGGLVVGIFSLFFQMPMV